MDTSVQLLIYSRLRDKSRNTIILLFTRYAHEIQQSERGRSYDINIVIWATFRRDSILRYSYIYYFDSKNILHKQVMVAHTMLKNSV
jgi:hypothetical protein